MVTCVIEVLLEVVLVICDTEVTSADELIMKGRFNMVEFGEQLRRAREEKGMTQQSLAEQLYVTRQAVSRWECGDRYPDLLTTKKISQILEVSLDDLLSGKEMEKVVERNPVIEKKSVNNIMIALYAFVVISFFITIVDIIIRFPLQSEMIDYNDIQAIVINVLALLIQIFFFAYGFVNAIRGMLSPKRMGAVIVAFFAATCITGNVVINSNVQIVLWWIVLIIPNIVGAVATFAYFVSGKKSKIYSTMIYLVTIWGMFRIIYSNYNLIVHANQYLSMNSTVRLVLEIAIHCLVIYQTYVLWIKRQNAIDIS
jgi:transcriptional regulator with XRE-family HTH domain